MLLITSAPTTSLNKVAYIWFTACSPYLKLYLKANLKPDLKPSTPMAAGPAPTEATLFILKPSPAQIQPTGTYAGFRNPAYELLKWFAAQITDYVKFIQQIQKNHLAVALCCSESKKKNGGTDGNRTRDLLRDRQAF